MPIVFFTPVLPIEYFSRKMSIEFFIPKAQKKNGMKKNEGRSKIKKSDLGGRSQMDSLKFRKKNEWFYSLDWGIHIIFL